MKIYTIIIILVLISSNLYSMGVVTSAIGSVATPVLSRARDILIDEVFESKMEQKEQQINKALDVLAVTASNNQMVGQSNIDKPEYYTRIALAVVTVAAAGGAAWSDKFRYHAKDTLKNIKDWTWDSDIGKKIRDSVHLKRDKTKDLGIDELKDFKDNLDSVLTTFYNDKETIEKLKKAKRIKVYFQDDDKDETYIDGWIDKKAQEAFKKKNQEDEFIKSEYERLKKLEIDNINPTIKTLFENQTLFPSDSFKGLMLTQFDNTLTTIEAPILLMANTFRLAACPFVKLWKNI
ncbi:hypothetical protein KJ644_01680 [Candidatus Dependentiae bacterium]|nr:hypothetical protein [Candidatus Dependentiae bacterium]MBU4387162.1 hypothetical protein [Candidatus Dependentiae bacterium]